MKVVRSVGEMPIDPLRHHLADEGEGNHDYRTGVGASRVELVGTHTRLHRATVCDHVHSTVPMPEAEQ